jgi:hypothetical protein
VILSIEIVAFTILVVASSASVIWYFRARRKILRFIKEFTEELEKELRPSDKEYVLLGYLVGYRARYKLEDGRNVYVLLTTTPKHSLFYYPIARALGREDRVTIMLELAGRNVLRDLHAVRKNESRLLNVLLRDLGERAGRLNRTVLETSKGDYEVFYEEPRDLDLADGSPLFMAGVLHPLGLSLIVQSPSRVLHHVSGPAASSGEVRAHRSLNSPTPNTKHIIEAKPYKPSTHLPTLKGEASNRG